MPAEVFDIDEFVELSAKAEHCTVKRLNNVVKLKLRSPKMLYTLKVDSGKAEKVFKKIKCEIREV
jgi:ferritin-like protein